MSRKVIDERGKVFGRLTVIKRAGSNKYREAIWFCKCECGTEAKVIGSRLRSGYTKSCGCLRGSKIRLPEGEASLNALVWVMRRGAKKRGYVWDLRREQVRALTQQHCFYCGIEPNQVIHPTTANGGYIYNGIDRVDNNKGYTPENVVPCCGFCNAAKRTKTVDEFQAWVCRVYAHFGKQREKL